MKIASIDEISDNQKVILREDFNVPLQNGDIRDATRIDAALPTIKKILSQGAKLLILSHLGRPEEGSVDPQLSLAPVANYLSDVLDQPVSLETDWLNGIDWQDKQIALAENVRFLTGEKANDPVLAKAMAKDFDVFVMDAFACAHRAQASTAGISEFIPLSCAGPLLLKEIDILDAVMVAPKRPLVAIIGGAKVSTKIVLLEQLLTFVDQLIVGGGIANTFIKAVMTSVGRGILSGYLANSS